MLGTEKGKSKALATASTLQKVVCPAPPADPQEILSNGWRKVGEQKRVTNRLANGHPDRGVGISSRDSSFREHTAPTNRQNGRDVLDKMFGHMRPHHIVMPTAVLQGEEKELETGLGSQAARVAYFRPSIAPSLNELPKQTARQAADGAAPAAGAGAGRGSSSELAVPSDVAVGGDEGDGDGARPSPPSPSSPVPAGGSGRAAHHARWNGGAAAVAQLRQGASLRRTASGRGSSSGSGGGGGGGSGGGNTPSAFGANGRICSPRSGTGERRGALPVVGRAGHSDWGAGGGVAGPSSHMDTTRLPMALGNVAAAAAHCSSGDSGINPRRRRASISGGDTILPAIGLMGGHGGSSAAAAAAAGMGGARVSVGRTRRTSLTLGNDSSEGLGGGSAAAAAAVLPTRLFAPHRTSMPGSSSGCGGLGGGVVHATRMSSNGAPAAGGGGGGGGSSSPSRSVVRGGGGGGGPSPQLESTGSPTPAFARLGQVHVNGHSAPLAKLVHLSGFQGGGGSGGAATSPVAAADAPASPSTLALVAQVAELHCSGGGGGGRDGIVVNPAVPLSGLENLAATGLGDAIAQLRHIRMGGSGGVSFKDARDRKAEPGLAGLTPLQLLPAPLPPLDIWQAVGKQVPELDPCKGIRLVDTANYVLPRPTAEANLQVRMAQHQAAMRHLIKAEGAPMSDEEMEAVKLLGRLERSGARHRNFDTMDSPGREAADDEAG